MDLNAKLSTQLERGLVLVLLLPPALLATYIVSRPSHSLSITLVL